MRLMLLGVCLILAAGCSPVEFTKTIWGSSTRALEEARANALTKTYAKPYWDTLRMAMDVVTNQQWVVFKKDEVKGYMVLMGIKGAVNTTEVGVFFVEVDGQQTRIEISSLSTNAKRRVAKRLFHGIDVALGTEAFDPAIDAPIKTPEELKAEEEAADEEPKKAVR